MGKPLSTKKIAKNLSLPEFFLQILDEKMKKEGRSELSIYIPFLLSDKFLEIAKELGYEITLDEYLELISKKKA